MLENMVFSLCRYVGRPKICNSVIRNVEKIKEKDEGDCGGLHSSPNYPPPPKKKNCLVSDVKHTFLITFLHKRVGYYSVYAVLIR